MYMMVGCSYESFCIEHNIILPNQFSLLKEIKETKHEIKLLNATSSEKTNSTIPYGQWKTKNIIWPDYDDLTSMPSTSNTGKQPMVEEDDDAEYESEEDSE